MRRPSYTPTRRRRYVAPAPAPLRKCWERDDWEANIDRQIAKLETEETAKTKPVEPKPAEP